MDRSQKLFARAQKVLVGGVNSPVRAFKSVGGAPRFAASGQGAILVDADKKRYVDYCMSWGPLIFGHARRELVAAARAALDKGSTFGAATEAEFLLAEDIRDAMPSMELVRLTSSGTEAVMSALRVARAFTKRELVIKFTGCYHGHVDSLLVQAGSGAITLGTPDSAGVPPRWAETTLSLPYNELPAVRRAFQKHKGRIAAVIVEPFVGNMGVVLPENGFLEGLREITRKDKALLIFDEVITGFRVAYGGAQSLFDITPDLTTIGKIVGGGMPMGAYGGRKEIMSLVAPLGPVYQAGTLSGNPVAVAAGRECLRLLREEDPYPRLAQITDYLLSGLAAEFNRARVRVQIHSVASMFTIFFSEKAIRDYASAMSADKKAYGRFFQKMLQNGVYLPPAQWEAAFTSFSHEQEHLDKTILAARKALRSR